MIWYPGTKKQNVSDELHHRIGQSIEIEHTCPRVTCPIRKCVTVALAGRDDTVHRKITVHSKASINVRSAGAYKPNGCILDDGRCSRQAVKYC